MPGFYLPFNPDTGGTTVRVRQLSDAELRLVARTLRELFERLVVTA